MANLTTKQAFLNQSKNSSDYWRDREDTQAIINEQMLNNFDSEVQQLYNSMIAECEKEIQSFYQKYASDSGITLSAAKKKVSNMDVKAYESEAERLVKTKKLTQKAKEELKLYNATMKINRLRLLEANIGLHLVNGYSDLERMTKQKMTDETVAEYKRQAGILGETVKDVETRAKNLVNQSFQNATWSERIWTNQTALKNTLSTELMRGMIAGKSAFTIASNIRKRFDVSSTEAKRLARTELVRCQAGAQIDSYTEHGWKEYEFRAYGSKSCEICRTLNGKHYPLADAMPAENLPPMHPNCRCSTIPYEDEDEYQQWLLNFKNEAVDFIANDDIMKDTDRVYSETEINQIAEKAYEIGNRYVDNKSKWSGKINVVDETSICRKEWDCSITVSNKVSPHMILHEQLHAHSISYYDMETYIRYRNIEESTVQLMAQEISKVEGIEITKSGYDELVNSLRAIKDRTEINMTDLEFAKSLIEMPVVERLFWLEEKIHEHVIQSDSVNESIELNNLLEGLIM